MTLINTLFYSVWGKKRNQARPLPRTQRGSAPSPAASALRSGRSADPSVSERQLLSARPSLNTKNMARIVTHRPPTQTPDRIFSESEEWSFVSNYVDYINWCLAKGTERKRKVEYKYTATGRARTNKSFAQMSNIGAVFLNPGRVRGQLLSLRNGLLHSRDFTRQHI